MMRRKILSVFELFTITDIAKPQQSEEKEILELARSLSLIGVLLSLSNIRWGKGLRMMLILLGTPDSQGTFQSAETK